MSRVKTRPKPTTLAPKVPAPDIIEVRQEPLPDRAPPKVD